jgi:iron complex outermembrane receptor protein
MRLLGMKQLLLFSGIFFFSVNIYSQSLPDTIHIHEISVTGKKIFKKEEAGIKTTKVDSMVMIDKINVSLSDILSQNTTVFIKDLGRGALATASFRGTAPSHTQVYWNGISINSPMLGMTDFSLIPAFIIDDLELNHGAASLQSGSGGLGGSINIQNTPGWDNHFSWRYYQGIGSYSTYDEFLQLNAGNRKIQSKTRLYHDYSKNDYEYINKTKPERPLVKNENADYMKTGFTQEFYIRPSVSNVFTLKVWGQISDRSLPTVMSYEGEGQSNLNNQKDSTLKITADWAFYTEKIKFLVRSGIDYQKTGYTLVNRVSGVGMDLRINSLSKAFSWYNHLNFEHNLSKRVSYNISFDFNRFDVKTYEEIEKTGYDRIRNDYLLFGGIYYSLSEKINLSFMLRDEYNGNTLAPVMFNIGFSCRPIKKQDLILKANFSRNYHQPTLNDLYWQPGGNPDLLPEESYSGEFSLEYYKVLGTFDIQQELTPYYSEIDDWIIWLPSVQGYWQPFNLKKVKSYGLEYHLKLIKKVRTVEIQLHGNYALTKSLNWGDPLFLGDGSYGKQLPFIPVHSGNVLLSVSYKGYYLRFQNSSYSERFRFSSNEIGEGDDSEDIGIVIREKKRNGWYYPYFMNNLTIGKILNLKKYQFGLDFKINNLFNEEYRTVLNRFMPGRNYELMLKISYNK